MSRSPEAVAAMSLSSSSFSTSSSSSSSASSLTTRQRMLSAGTGAICTALMMTPLDVVKIRLQNQRHPVNTGECFIYSNGLMDHLCRSCKTPAMKKKIPCEWYERPGNFTGTLDALIRIPQQEGVRSLWSGLSPTLIMAVPLTAFYFSAYDCLLARIRALAERRRRGGAAASDADASVPGALEALAPPMIAGTVARSASVTLVAPLEVVRTKMQSEHMSLTEIGAAVRATAGTHGWRGLYLGLVPTLWRDVPFSALYWAGYEIAKARILAARGAQEMDFVTAFVAGAISGTIASVATNPFDVVKTSRQIELGREVADAKEAARIRNEKMLTVMRRIVSKHGLLGLWSGIVPRVAKVAPACAIMIGSYEYFKVHFAHSNAARATAHH